MRFPTKTTIKKCYILFFLNFLRLVSVAAFSKHTVPLWHPCCHTGGNDCCFEPMEYVWPHNIVLVMNITVESCAYVHSILIHLRIWDNKYPNVDVFPWLPLSDLKTAPVQGDDFSSGTSSRSTKLIHGGVRYLQKAIMKLDYKQVNASFFLRSWHLSAEFLVPLVILLYLPSCVHFSLTGRSDMFSLNDWLPGIFWSCFKEFLTTKPIAVVIILWVNS